MKNNIPQASLDIKQQNLEQLKNLFPTIFSSDVLNIKKLQELTGLTEIAENDSNFNFTWHGKKAALKNALTSTNATLRPINETPKNCSNKSSNIFIEGENLEVLKILQKSYLSKIKCIYIDPPYNTGKDFIYKDKYSDTIENYKKFTNQVDENNNIYTSNAETSGKYHTNWLNMMYPRLTLARNLLTDDGVIFISIDDNEQANLKKVCDEIFGEDNFIANAPRKTVSHIRKVSSSELQNLHDYVIIYSKNKTFLKLNKKIKGRKEYPFYDDVGKYRIKSLQNSGEDGKKSARPNLYYPVYYNKKTQDFSLEANSTHLKILPKKVSGEDGRWLWSREKFLKDKKLLMYYKNTLYRKEYYTTEQDLNEYESYKTWLEQFQNSEGSNCLRTTFNNKQVFVYPKPPQLLKYLIHISAQKSDIILDFFTGSGTTGDAVMQLNAEDGGNRKYILVQLPEPIDKKKNKEIYDFCIGNNLKPVISSITQERLRRAGAKILADNNESKEPKDLSNLDIGFKSYKLDTTNFKAWDNEDINLLSKLENSIDNLKENRTKEDLFTEILLKFGLPLDDKVTELTLAGKTVYSLHNSYLMMCLDTNITKDIALEILDYHKQHASESIQQKANVVFIDNHFKNDEDKVNIKQTLTDNNIILSSF